MWLTEQDTIWFAPVGGNVTLVCDVCMNPWGQFVWEFEGGDLPNNAQEDNKLIITYLDEDDFGFYTCSARNTFLTTEVFGSFELELQLRGPPAQPKDLTVLTSTSVSASLGWTCGHNGGDDHMWFELHVYETGEQNAISNENVTTTCLRGQQLDPPHRVGGLEADTDYTFTVSARNNIDTTQEAESPADTGHRTIGQFILHKLNRHITLIHNTVILKYEIKLIHFI